MDARILLAAAIVTGACSPPSNRSANGPQSPPAASTDDTLTIALGEDASTRDRGLAVTFVRQDSESRCPANVVCVWQGDAGVRLRAKSAVGIVEATIHTARDPKVIEVGGYRISLVDVQPYPGASDSTRTPRVVVRVIRSQ